NGLGSGRHRPAQNVIRASLGPAPAPPIDNVYGRQSFLDANVGTNPAALKERWVDQVKTGLGFVARHSLPKAWRFSRPASVGCTWARLYCCGARQPCRGTGLEKSAETGERK